eukprot:6876550-Prymnesium_polylepis.1
MASQGVRRETARALKSSEVQYGRQWARVASARGKARAAAWGAGPRRAGKSSLAPARPPPPP